MFVFNRYTMGNGCGGGCCSIIIGLGMLFLVLAICGSLMR